MVNAKDTEPASLGEVSADRLRKIATQYNIIYSNEKKHELLELVKDAMMAELECTVCEGQCEPDSHIFPPVLLALAGSVPPASGPLSLLSNANNTDAALGENYTPFVDGQISGASQQVNLADTVNNGAQALFDQTVSQEQQASLELAAQARQREAERALAAQRHRDRLTRQEEASILNFRNALRLPTPRQRLPTPHYQPNLSPDFNLRTPNAHITLPPPNNDPSLEGIQAILQQQQTFQLQQQQHQQNQQLAFIEVLKSITQRSEIPLPNLPFNAASNSIDPQTAGRARIVPLQNEAFAQMLGVQPPPIMQIEGDVSNLDMSKLKKKMHSGENSSGGYGVIKEQSWPHHLLSRTQCPNVPQKNSAMTNLHFFSGMLNKILVESAPNSLPLVHQNKLLYTANLANLAHTASWPQILEINAMFFCSLEQGQQTWDNWSAISAFLDRARQQVRQSIPAGKSHDGPPNKKQKTQDDKIEGIPASWIKSNKFCLIFNIGKCQKPGDHYIADGNVFVKHLCAGCVKLGKGNMNDHGASSCDNKPFHNLF